MYPYDGKFYDVIIKAIDGDSVTVAFIGYSETLTVKIEDLRKKKNKLEADKNGEIAIPDSLRILPTDDQRTKDRKKKTLKSIKYKNHKAQLEKIEADKQKEWTSFQKKISKKKTYGFISSVALKQKSAFATPDSDFGLVGKVGVSGSGKKMTQPPKMQKISKTEKRDLIL